MTKRDIELNLKPFTLDDIPDPLSDEFTTFLNSFFDLGLQLANSMDDWQKGSLYHNGTVQGVSLTSSSSYSKIRKSLKINELWCGRISTHTPESIRAAEQSQNGGGASLFRSLSHKLTKAQLEDRRATIDLTEVERQNRVMHTQPKVLYERFRRGLLEYHSENEREYIEACRETECLQVLQPHVAEIWRLTYVTPPPTNPRTFVVLLLSRELNCAPKGQRSFMNISIPFNHPACPEKQNAEKTRVRGKYVSVELVTECGDEGESVEWKMATSSDAGGNIPRFVTNATLPSKVAEDVPSFIKWMTQRFPGNLDE